MHNLIPLMATSAANAFTNKTRNRSVVTSLVITEGTTRRYPRRTYILQMTEASQHSFGGSCHPLVMERRFSTRDENRT